MRQCRCQVHVYAAMPLASTCICGNAAGKFMYMRQCRWEATIPLAKSCICGNAAGKRQCRGQVHVYTAIPFSCKNVMSNQHYRTRDGINIIAHAMHTLSCTGDKTSMIFASKSHLQASNSPSRWQRCHSTQEQSSHILSSLSPAIFQPLRMLFWHTLPP